MPRRETTAPSPFATLLRALGRRPLTVHEARAHLASKGYAPDEVDAAVRRARDERLLDDVALAEDYLLLRARRRLEGPHRLVRELVRRGVDEDRCWTLWRSLAERGEVDEAALLERRVERLVAGGRATARRVYNALLRAGFEPDAAREAVIRRGLD